MSLKSNIIIYKHDKMWLQSSGSQTKGLRGQTSWSWPPEVSVGSNEHFDPLCIFCEVIWGHVLIDSNCLAVLQQRERGCHKHTHTLEQLLTPTVFIHSVNSEPHVLLYSTTRIYSYNSPDCLGLCVRSHKKRSSSHSDVSISPDFKVLLWLVGGFVL